MEKDIILILTAHQYPCSHAVLESVFAKELGNHHKFLWILRGDISNGNEVKWYNSKVLLSKLFKKNDLLSKLRNRVNFFSVLFNSRDMLQNTVKIVFVRDMPFTAYVLSLFKQKYGFRLYYQHSAPLGDLNIDYYKENKKTTSCSVLIKGYSYNFFLRMVLERSDVIFPITTYLKKELSSFLPHSSIVPLTMGVDEDWINYQTDAIEKLDSLKENNRIIAYLGTLNFLRNPRFILDIMASIKNEGFHCKFLMIGKTDSLKEERLLREYCVTLGLENDVIFTGFVSRKMVRNYLSYCDLTLSPIPPVPFYMISSPTKLYESLGSGVPVIGNYEVFEQEKVLLDSGGGIAVDYNVVSFAEAAMRLLRDSKLRKEMSLAGQNYIIKNYSYKRIAENISQYFN